MTEKLIKLYISKYINGLLDFNGIKLIPDMSDTNDYLDVKKTPKLYWTIENPNDISYSERAVKLFISDSIYDFYKISGINTKDWYDTYREIENNYLRFYDIEPVYISKKLKMEIKQIMRKTHDFELPKFKWVSDYEIIDYYIWSDGYDEITIDVSARLFNSINTDTGEKITTEKINGIFDKMYNNDIFIEFCDNLASPISNFIWNIDTICEKDTMYLNSSLTFFDEEGNRL